MEILKIKDKNNLLFLPVLRMTDGYSGSDLTALAKDAALGPIRGRYTELEAFVTLY